jgi:hypothetical protein
MKRTRQWLKFFGHDGDSEIAALLEQIKAVSKRKPDSVLRAFAAATSEQYESFFLEKYKRSQRSCLFHKSALQCMRRGDCRPPGGDHLEIFRARDHSHYILVSHPYDLCNDTLNEMMYWAYKHNLTVRVTGFDWYFIGRTLRVEFRPSPVRTLDYMSYLPTFYQKEMSE